MNDNEIANLPLRLTFQAHQGGSVRACYREVQQTQLQAQESPFMAHTFSAKNDLIMVGSSRRLFLYWRILWTTDCYKKY